MAAPPVPKQKAVPEGRGKETKADLWQDAMRIADPQGSIALLLRQASQPGPGDFPFILLLLLLLSPVYSECTFHMQDFNDTHCVK